MSYKQNYNKIDSEKLEILVGQHTSLFSRCRHLLYTPLLAKVTDFYQDTFLEQLQYWISRPNVGKQINGVKWVKDSMSDWQRMFKYMSHTQVYRTIRRLLKNHLLLRTKKLNRKSSDNIYWYTINFNQLNKLFIAKYPQRAESLGIIQQPSTKKPIGIDSCKSETGTAHKSLSNQRVANWNGTDVNRSSQERPIPHRNSSHSSQERPIPHRNATTKSSSKSITKSSSSSNFHKSKINSSKNDYKIKMKKAKLMNLYKPNKIVPNKKTYPQNNKKANRNGGLSQNETKSEDSHKSKPVNKIRKSSDLKESNHDPLRPRGYSLKKQYLLNKNNYQLKISKFKRNLIKKLGACYVDVNSKNNRRYYEKVLGIWINNYGYSTVSHSLNLLKHRVMTKGAVHAPIPFINTILRNLKKDKRIKQLKAKENDASYATPKEIDKENQEHAKQEARADADGIYDERTRQMKKTHRLPMF